MSVRELIARQLELGIAPGVQYFADFEGCNVVLMATEDAGIHTGRRRYLVACVTCNKLMHEATTGPLYHLEAHRRHVLELERLKAVFRR